MDIYIFWVVITGSTVGMHLTIDSLILQYVTSCSVIWVAV